MIVLLAIVVLPLAAWAAGAAGLAALRRISFHQAFFFLPLKLAYRIGDRADNRSGGNLRAGPPVIYAILHQSRLDPALMLSLLPEDTLHILDERSARSPFLEPWREMARTIAFNPRHVFVSRRLVRHLKGRGRLAVYMPDGVAPDTRPYRLYRAIAKIAAAADARIVPVSVKGSRNTIFRLRRDVPRQAFGRLTVSALEALTMAELVARSPRDNATMALALYERLAEADAA